MSVATLTQTFNNACSLRFRHSFNLVLENNNTKTMNQLAKVAGLFLGGLVLLVALYMMKIIFQSRYEINLRMKPDLIYITISSTLLPAIGKLGV